ncbi:hypothetical protein, partial [Streptomyces cyaneofuscatus]|uniref:hypothetical protein n=1 Tax=Streptomyces cyaneofuscatus TaxID=66883 RepID=UPI002FEF5E4F
PAATIGAASAAWDAAPIVAMAIRIDPMNLRTLAPSCENVMFYLNARFMPLSLSSIKINELA